LITRAPLLLKHLSTMRFVAFFATLAAVLAPVILAGPSAPKSVERYAGMKTGNHIVRLKPGVSRKEMMRKLKLPSDTANWDLINGFSGLSFTHRVNGKTAYMILAPLDDETLNALMESDDVESVAEDGVVRIMGTVTQ
jgi:hypothetical protein